MIEDEKQDAGLTSKYHRVIKDRYDNTARVDVYDVLRAFNVTCPALQHLVKKALFMK